MSQKNETSAFLNAYRRRAGKPTDNFRLANHIDATNMSAGFHLGHVNPDKVLSYMGPPPKLIPSAKDADGYTHFEALVKPMTMPIMLQLYLRALEISAKELNVPLEETGVVTRQVNIRDNAWQKLDEFKQQIDLLWTKISNYDRFNQLLRAEAARLDFIYEHVLPPFCEWAGQPTTARETMMTRAKSIFSSDEEFSKRFTAAGDEMKEVAKRIFNIKPIISSEQLLDDTGYETEDEVRQLNERLRVFRQTPKPR